MNIAISLFFLSKGRDVVSSPYTLRGFLVTVGAPSQLSMEYNENSKVDSSVRLEARLSVAEESGCCESGLESDIWLWMGIKKLNTTLLSPCVNSQFHMLFENLGKIWELVCCKIWQLAVTVAGHLAFSPFHHLVSRRRCQIFETSLQSFAKGNLNLLKNFSSPDQQQAWIRQPGCENPH